jgi:hypothetical protein
MKHNTSNNCFSFSLLLFLILILGISTPSSSMEIKFKTFDKNGNGIIDKGKEAEILLKHINNSSTKELDKNLDGTISAIEADEHNQKVAGDIVDNIEEFNSIVGNNPGMPLKEAKEEYGKKDPILSKLKLRRTAENISVLEKGKSFDTGQGALFAYTRDEENDNDIWQARGAILYPFKTTIKDSEGNDVTGDRHNKVLSSWAFVPQITFDRLSNDKNETKDLDSLSFKVGIEAEYTGGFFNAQYFRFLPVYNTDFDLESEQFLGQFQWEPVINDLGIGQPKNVPLLPLKFRWRPLAHMEYGYVTNAGDKSNLKEDDDYFRIGPKIRADFWFTFKALKRFVAHVDWQYLGGLSGRPDDSELFEAGLTGKLDQAGHFQAEITYRDGDTPLTKEPTETINFGLNVKF